MCSVIFVCLCVWVCVAGYVYLNMCGYVCLNVCFCVGYTCICFDVYVQCGVRVYEKNITSFMFMNN